MGQRTVFYKPNNGKTLRENFETGYKHFREWMLVNNEQSLTEYNERLISVELEIFLKEHLADKFEEWNQDTIDSLVFEYLLTYCDNGPGQGKFEIVGPMMSTWRYDKSNRLINDSSDKDLIAIWNYLVQGRSIINELKFISPDNDNQIIGFWDSKERDFLRQRLLRFDNRSQDNEGLDHVLTVLNDMKDDNSDLIFNVEK